MGPLDAPDVSVEELAASMPEAVRDAFPPFGWSEAALWRLRLPVEEVPVETFAWLLDLPVWRWEGRRFQVSMRQVLADPERYRAHHDKAARADPACPIHAATHRGRLIILDGYHRLLQTLVRGEPTIKVMRVAAADLE